MCHLCCISFPFLHLFPARCASEITALCTEAGVQGRQRPRQPYRCLAGRKEIRKFAEIFDQQNKQFSCQAPNRQLGEPAAICTAPLAASFWSTVPTEPPPRHRAHPVPGALSAGAPHPECTERCCGWQIWGTGTPAQLSPVANRHGTMGAAPRVHPKPCPRARPRHGVGARTGQRGRGLRPNSGAGGEGGVQGEARQRASIVHSGQTNAGDSAGSRFPACAGHGPSRTPPGPSRAAAAPWPRVGCGVPLAPCVAVPLPGGCSGTGPRDAPAPRRLDVATLQGNSSTWRARGVGS